jgi:hypothetical protein
MNANMIRDLKTRNAAQTLPRPQAVVTTVWFWRLITPFCCGEYDVE